MLRACNRCYMHRDPRLRLLSLFEKRRKSGHARFRNALTLNADFALFTDFYVSKLMFWIENGLKNMNFTEKSMKKDCKNVFVSGSFEKEHQSRIAMLSF